MAFLSRSLPICGLILASVLGLTACANDDAVYSSDYDPAIAIDLAPVPPPQPSYEDKAALTDPRTQVWRQGHWEYQEGRYVWLPGEVLTRPSTTAVWSPDRWERRQYGWVFVHGYWQ